MSNESTSASGRPLWGIAALFDDFERKTLFTKYLFFLGWVEVLVLAVCWLYSLGEARYDRLGPVESPFPWKAYFLVSFLAPIAITFLVGVVIVAFNKYFAGIETSPGTHGVVAGDSQTAGRLHKLERMVAWLQRLPFLALLLLLAIGAMLFYKLDGILSFLTGVGEQSVRFLLIASAVLVALASVFGLLLILLNYQLRKKSMEYQYRSEVAERYGLIILEDNTVLSRDGRLLVDGRKSARRKTILAAEAAEGPPRVTAGAQLPRPADCEQS